MKGEATLVSPGKSAVFAQLHDGEAVIVDTLTACHFGLNRTAAHLWQSLQASGQTSGVRTDDLVDGLCRRFAVDRQNAERDVREFVAQLETYGLAGRAGT
jgi:hypothetical protein